MRQHPHDSPKVSRSTLYKVNVRSGGGNITKKKKVLEVRNNDLQKKAGAINLCSIQILFSLVSESETHPAGAAHQRV